MTKKQQKRWVYSPPKPSKPKVPENVKADVERKAMELVEAVLKPCYLKPPPEDEQFNYIVDIYTSWHRSYFYFCSKYACPGPNAIKPFFEDKFARLEYAGNDRFNLSYMRHTGQWFEIGSDLSLDRCLAAIQDNPLFLP